MKNSTFKLSRLLQWGTGLACAAVLAGCATVSDEDKPPEVQVTNRSNAFLKARQTGEVEKAYALTTPSYRAIKTKERFVLENGSVTPLKGGELLSVKCEEVRCVVRRNFQASSAAMGEVLVPISITEAWVNQDGQWWLYME